MSLQGAFAEGPSQFQNGQDWRLSFCSTCQSIFEFAVSIPYHLWNLEDLSQDKEWQIVPTELFENCESGRCRLCTCIVRNIFDYEATTSRAHAMEEGSIQLWAMRQGAEVQLKIDSADTQLEGQLLTISIYETLGVLKDLASVPAYTDDESTWRAISEWLDSCTGSRIRESQTEMILSSNHHYDPTLWRGYSKEFNPKHHRCQAKCLDTVLPSRLIDVAVHETLVRVVETSNVAIEVDTPYAALSHCWGPPERAPLRTMKSNCSKELYDIAFTLLDKTFQDAVTATRKMGLRYLWIDSLCIVQDDPEDWNRQSKIMGSIYANCHVNIVAAESEDASTGCFFARQPDRDRGFRIAISSLEQNDLRQRATQTTHPSGLPFEPEYLIELPSLDIRASSEQDLRAIFTCAVFVHSSSQLTSRRAWCFQESFLAPRSVYFGRNQVYFACRHVCASEAIPEGFSRSLEPDPRFNPESGNHVLEQIREWMQIVFAYSFRDITYWIDRLPALSGAARATFAKSPQIADRQYLGQKRASAPIYLAGLWNNAYLEPQLYWSVEGDYSHFGRRPSAPNAPSWSWASVRGKIIMFQAWHAMSGRTLHVVDATIDLETNDEFGACRGGRLFVSCRGIFAATVAAADSRHWLRIDGTEYPEVRAWLDEPLDSNDVFGVHGMYEDEPTGAWQDVGLLLQPAGGSNSADVYRRVGIFMISWRPWREHDFEWGCTLKNLILPTNDDVRITII